MPTPVILIFVAIGCLACAWAAWESWSTATATSGLSARRAIALCGLIPVGLGAVALAAAAADRTDLAFAAAATGFAAAGLFATLGLHHGVDLERQVRRIHGDLRDQQEALLQAEVERQRAQDAADVAKRRFLANMSHEMRTPLNGVLGAVDLLRASDDSDTDQRDRHMDIIDTSARCLLQLVDNVLDFTRHGDVNSTGRGSESEFELHTTLAGAWAVMETAAHQKDLTLSFDIAVGVPAVLRGDATYLLRILLNLLDNAVKFTDQGSVQVTARLEDPPATLSLGGGDVRAWIRIEVTDTGVGIGDTTKMILFEPLAQKDDSMTRPHGGTGMGLAVSRRLARAIGGRIEVSSERGVGSTFSLVAPFTAMPAAGAAGAARPAASTDPATSNGPADRPRRQLLVVDDDPVSRMIAESQVSSLGYEVDVVESGQAAIEALRRRDYSAVLMDCRMPGLDGYETTRRLRGQEHDSRLPVIAVTAHAREDERERCLAAGMDELLEKPVATEALAATLDRIVTH
ncbi:MAG: response regulator [Acidobacteriota bacterium]